MEEKDEEGRPVCPNLPDPILELLEYRIAERAQKRLTKAFFLIFGLLATVFSVLGYQGLSHINHVKKSIEEDRQEVSRMRREVQEQATDFTKIILPQEKRRLGHYNDLETRVRFKEYCPKRFSDESFLQWHKKNFNDKDPGTLAFAKFKEYFEKYNVCTISQLDDIINHPVQEVINDLYRNEFLYNRTESGADSLAKFLWGIRLWRGYSFDDAFPIMKEEEEAKNKRRKYLDGLAEGHVSELPR